MQYIYLNFYANGYLYVGSHVWEGEGIDPNYIGSSHIAKYYGWKPVKIKLLETVSDERRYKAETEWIKRYAKRFGIADCARFLDSGKNSAFTSRYRSGGRMLNLHAQDALNATIAAAKKVKEKGLSEKQQEHARQQIRRITKNQKTEKQLESSRKAMRAMQQKRLEKIKQDGFTESQKKASRQNIKKANAALTSETQHRGAVKRVEQQKKSGYKFGDMKACHTEEARLKAMRTRLERARKCKLSDGFIGCPSQIAAHLGITNKQAGAKVHEAYKYGDSFLRSKQVRFFVYE